GVVELGLPADAAEARMVGIGGGDREGADGHRTVAAPAGLVVAEAAAPVIPCQDCAKPTTSQRPVTSFAILIAASFASPPVESSITFGRPGTSRASASASSTTGGLSIEEKR